MENVSKFNSTNPEIPASREQLALVRSFDDVAVGDRFFSNDIVIEVYEINGEGDDKNLRYSRVDRPGDAYGSVSRREFEQRGWMDRFVPDYDTARKDAEDFLFNGKELVIQEFEESSTGLVHRSNKGNLISSYNTIDVQRKKLAIIEAMSRVLIEEQNNKLRSIRSKMESAIGVFRKELKRIMSLIGMIELYLGIEEELYQLQEGEPAPDGTPISLRQLVLYADEELGDYSDGGIDFRQLDRFDDWLITGKHYEDLLPEPRGIVAIKPRRNNKDYKDPIENAMLNVWNHQTYFMIRNGENVYRVCTPHLNVGKTMFPRRDEFHEMLSKIHATTWDSEREKLTDEKSRIETMYMRFSLFIQGLLDRTDVFKPIPDGLNVMDIEKSGGFDLIYDAEFLLPTGRLPFVQWRTEINKTIGRGSRIMFVPSSYKGFNRYYSRGEGYLKYYSSEYNMPGEPPRGVYVIDEVDEVQWDNKVATDVKTPVIRFLPSSKTYSWGDLEEKDRRNRVAWCIDYRQTNILNYDRISLDDIDFYLHSRIDRPNYLSMLPILREIRVRLIDEMKREDQFRDMIRGMALRKGMTLGPDIDARIDEAIEWFKYKNIWKRPITEDDAKACRMIEKRVFNGPKDQDHE